MKATFNDDIEFKGLDDLVNRDRSDETTYTYSGAPIPPLKRGLPKEINSICPECLKVIKARLFAEGGKVCIDKTCPEHGYFKDVYWSDVELYLRAEEFSFGEGKGLENPMVTGGTQCPENCGLCDRHISHTALGNIDLTNRCNMDCPICFANSAKLGYVYEPDLETIKRQLQAYRDMRPVPGRVVQFSGGEPTIHPQFLEIVAAARDMGYVHIQMACNGIKLADEEFCRKTAEAGMHTVYLQFDGCSDEHHEKTRGRKGYYPLKLKAIENMARYGIHFVFTPTIVRGFNDDQVGPIVEFAVRNAERCSGISFQPVACTGRINEQERQNMRYTIPDLVHDIERQTGGLITKDDWYPISCTSPFSKFYMAIRGHETINVTCHPHCSLATYLVMDIDDPVNTATPITSFVNVPGMLRDMNKLAFKTDKAKVKLFSKIQALGYFRKHFDKNKAPKGLTFTRFLEAMNGLTDKEVGRKGRGTQWKFLLVGAMHFMDAYNYDTDRVRRCVIHYAAPDGTMYPFCSYNSGPFNRERIEKTFSIPLEEYKAKQGKS